MNFRSRNKSRKLKNTIIKKIKNAGKKNNMVINKPSMVIKPAMVIIKPANKLKEFLKMANKQYDSIDEVKKNYRNKIKKDIEHFHTEQEWVDNNLHILMDFMGNKILWEYLHINTIGQDGIKRSDRNVPINNVNTAVFSGAHWTSRKANDSVWVDPYKEYQIPDSNQFCQTYAMMYLLDKLPEKIVDKDKKFTKYYEYTHHALDFIKDIIDTHIDTFYDYAIEKKIRELLSNDTINDVNDIIDKNQEIIDDHHREKMDTIDALNECMKYKNICLNAVI